MDIRKLPPPYVCHSSSLIHHPQLPIPVSLPQYTLDRVPDSSGLPIRMTQMPILNLRSACVQDGLIVELSLGAFVEAFVDTIIKRATECLTHAL